MGKEDEVGERTAKVYPVTLSTPKAITVRCPDRRFRQAHLGLIRDEFGLKPEDYWPLKPAGGAGVLAKRAQMQSEGDSLLANIDLFVQHAGEVPIQHIILISHQDCKRYDEIKGREPDWERQDLYVGIDLLSRKYPGIEISAFYARFTEDRSKIFFEIIKTSTLLKPTA